MDVPSPAPNRPSWRQAERAKQQQIDQQRVGRDRGQRDPEHRLRAVDRAHEAADRHEPEGRQDGPDQTGEIFLRMMRRRGGLSERKQDLFGPEAKRHQRQRDQQRCPQADAQRSADQMRVARAEGLRGQRCDGRHQAHAGGEADEKHGVRQRCGGHRLGAETPDHGNVGRHHRDLAELGQRDRHARASASRPAQSRDDGRAPSRARASR